MSMIMKRTAIIVFAALASGCAGASFNGREQALSIAEQHPISVDSQIVTMTLSVADAQGDFSDLDRARIRAFADSYLKNGHGDLSITAPSGGLVGDRDVSSSVLEPLYEQGVPLGAMTKARYGLGEGSTTDIILSFTRYVATPSACGVWEGMRERDYRNMNSPNFGCATQNNLAAMIGDPHDLIAPADMTDPDSALRVRAVQKYREGEKTSTQTDNAIDTNVAN